MELGWSIVLETTGGPVGMWTCWLENGFKIFYPHDVDVPDEMIMETLGVTHAKPVADDHFHERKWGDFYSERVGSLGRVWIENDKHDSYGYHIPTIRNCRPVKHYFGHDQCKTIRTFEFTFCSETQPDAPTHASEYIKPYLDKFMQLFVKVAKLTGDITAINIESGLVLYTPEQLEKAGCTLERWRQDYTNYCYTKYNDYEVILYSGNSLVSWITVLKREANNDLTAEEIKATLESFDNSGGEAINLVPLVADMIEKAVIYG